MALDILLFSVGVLVAALTLRDVFETVVVPGGSRASLRVTHRVVCACCQSGNSSRPAPRPVGTFAPLVLVAFLRHLDGLLTFAFGLMAYALRDDFQPPLQSFGDAFYLVGSSLATVGLSASHPARAGRWVILAAGFCGLAVMTMAVTYLLEVQNSIARRDTGIIKLNTSAGEPPSALTLLERFAAIRNQDALARRTSKKPQLVRDGAAEPLLAPVPDLLPVGRNRSRLASGSRRAARPRADGRAVLDDDDLYGPAVLLRDEGPRMAGELAAVIRLKPNQRRLRRRS